MKPRSWIKLVLIGFPLLLLLAVAALIVSVRPTAPPPPTAIPTWLPADAETRVDLTPGSTVHLYNFNAPRLKLDSRTPGFAFTAQIRNAAGQTIADFSDLLQNVQFTLAPNSGQYQIAVSAANPQQAGTVSLALGSAVIASQTLDGTALRAPNCRLTNAAGVNVMLRSAPAAQYAILGMLTPDGALAVIGRTDNNWYSVSVAERQGWVTGDVIALDGDCAALPLLRNPAIPSAPADAQAFLVQVDRDGSGTFHEAISTPDGDTADLIWVRVINLYTAPPNNYREFTLKLNCAGAGTESVRWGSALQSSSVLKCGESVVLPFLDGNAQQPIAVRFAPGSRQSYVEYTLSVQPAAASG